MRRKLHYVLIKDGKVVAEFFAYTADDALKLLRNRIESNPGSAVYLRVGGQGPITGEYDASH